MKKNTYKKIVITLIILLIFTFVAIRVQANASVEAGLTGNVAEIKPGEEINLTLKIEPKNIKENINSYKATLVYNQDIFEEVSYENFESKNSWEELQYNQNTGEFIAIKKAGTKKVEEVVTIKLKVKQKATAGKTKVTIKDIIVSDGKNDIEAKQISTELNILNDQISEPTTITSSKYNIGKDSYITKVPMGTTIKEFRQNVTANKEMVFTDKSGKVLNDEDILSTGVKLKLASDLTYTIVVTGDIDGNQKISVTDLAQLKLHCIEKQFLTNSHLKAADINFDDKVTVTDLAQLKRMLLEQIDPE